ncbi:peptidase M50 [Desulfatibacillum aliphaticivorans]|uniref:Peptidase M50 n=2 Tax=Desulfatibacillum aliphaticivorans TaxID=218208 RepID=B8FJ15_DESAL|nr:peptidase M50 [Desulfatibacillum aliphaticivorans]
MLYSAEFIVPAVFLFFAIMLVPRVRVWLRLKSLRFRKGGVFFMERGQGAATFRPIFEEAERAMEALGFEHCCTSTVTPLWTSEPPKQIMAFAHKQAMAFAIVLPPTIPNGKVPFEVHFQTLFDDGTVLSTVDGISLSIPAYPDWFKLEDPGVGDYIKQWEAHQNSCESRESNPMPATIENYMELERRFGSETIPNMEARGDLIHADEPFQWRLTSSKAWALSMQMIKGEQNMMAQAQTVAAPQTRFSGNALMAAEIAAYDRHQKAEEFFSSGSQGKIGRFILSAAAFVAAFTWLWSFENALLLLLVIFIHEIGHYLAMGLFGYKNRQVFFVPFLGAATMGAKDDATIMQRVWVLLGGPAPGLLLGVICMLLFFHTHNDFMLMLGAMFLVINYLNLLPITPFDGGKILDALFFDRFPRAQFFFFLGSIFILASCGLLLSEPILLFIAVIFSFGIKAKWRQGSLAKKAMAALPPKAGEAITKKVVFKTLQEDAVGNGPYSQRLRLANTLIKLLGAPKPTQLELVKGALIYVGVLILPLIIVLLFFLQNANIATP